MFCTLLPVKRYIGVSYLLSFLYDSLITFLSIYGLLSSSHNRKVTLSGPNANFLKGIMKGNAIYFLVLVSFSLGTGILSVIDVDPLIRTVLASPHTAVTTCMSLKIFRQLRSSVLHPKSSSSRGETAIKGRQQQVDPNRFGRSRQASLSSINISQQVVNQVAQDIVLSPLENKEDIESLKDHRF